MASSTQIVKRIAKWAGVSSAALLLLATVWYVHLIISVHNERKVLQEYARLEMPMLNGPGEAADNACSMSPDTKAKWCNSVRYAVDRESCITAIKQLTAEDVTECRGIHRVIFKKHTIQVNFGESYGSPSNRYIEILYAD